MSETDAQDDTQKEGKKISLKVVSQDGNEIFFQVRARPAPFRRRRLLISSAARVAARCS